MTNADRAAVDALARHFAHETGGFWEHLTPREQATYRAKALDVVQVVGPIYQQPTADAAVSFGVTFPRPMSKEPQPVYDTDESGPTTDEGDK